MNLDEAFFCLSTILMVNSRISLDGEVLNSLELEQSMDLLWEFLLEGPSRKISLQADITDNKKFLSLLETEF